MNNKRVLLINPSYKFFYRTTRIKKGVPYTPLLSLAVLAAPLLKAGHIVKILDLNLEEATEKSLKEELVNFSPDYIGITFTTPLFNEMEKLCQFIKAYNDKIVLIGGGPHASSLPESTLKKSSLDIVVVGEGDFTLLDIINGKELNSIKGIYYSSNGEIISNPPREYIKDLDILAFPSWELYNLKKYKTTELLSRRTPAGYIETSRGCPYGCAYCNKSVFGRTFRVKSPERIVDEIEYMLRCGFKEIHIADDCFTANIQRAKKICDEIIRRNLDFPWATLTGIRIDRVDEELLKKMYNAGCYRVYFGIESGNQRILDGIQKGYTIPQIKEVVKLAKKVGLETFGFFMLALPGETEETMQDTINFAKELDLDMAKTTITTPLPATPLYEEWDKKGFIKSNDWTKLNLYTPSKEIFDHPNLSWETIERYYTQFYRSFYLRPKFIFKRILNDIRRGKIWSDIKYFLQTKW